jgi:hypothetical protein
MRPRSARRRRSKARRSPHETAAPGPHVAQRTRPIRRRSARAGGPSLPAIRKRIWPEPRVRPSLNREASRLRDVGSEDPFPGASPGNLFGANQPRNSAAIKYRVVGISNFATPITIGNWFWLVCKNRNAMSGARNWLCWDVLGPEAEGVQPSRPSATLRSRKSRKTLIRFDERSSSG